MNLIFSTVFLALLLESVVHYTNAVDRSNFKTCSQSGFCKRQRAVSKNQDSYVALISKLQWIHNVAFEVPLFSEVQNITLHLEVTGLEEQMFKISIYQRGEKRKRYFPTESLVNDPIKKGMKEESRSLNSFMASLGDNRIVIRGNPFSIDILDNKEVIMAFNSDGLLKFEPFRGKNDPNDASASNRGGTLNWIKNKMFGSTDDAIVEESDNGEPVDDDSQQSNNIDVTEDGATTLDNALPDDEDDDHEEVYDEENDVDLDDEDDNVNENPDEVPKADEPSSDAEKDDSGMYEESFKTHKDKKPYGPMSVGLDITFVGFNHVYGIPEHADTLSLKTTVGTDPYRLFNLDVFEYELDNPMALYGSIPVMYAHSSRRTVGVLWLNAAETWVDVERSEDKGSISRVLDSVTGAKSADKVDTHWFSETGNIEIYVMLGPHPKQAFRQYSTLTGTTMLPPLFSLGYHQSRWNYKDLADVAYVDQSFDDHDIPCDVIWLDLEHTDGKRYFTWDPHKFSNPIDMIQNVSRNGRKMVTLVDPHIKKDTGYGVFSDALSKNLFVKSNNGDNYDAWCWPGSSHWVDFMSPEARTWWADQFSLSQYKGSTLDLFTWNDMNEPSVFNGPEITMHKDVLHGNWENRDIHNVYGMLQQMATHEGLIKRSGDQHLRSFVLARAFFVGSQRFGAIWTGDNTASFDHLKASIPMLLSISVAGLPFVGADVGGFFGNPDEELIVRWYQAAAFQPFFRAHAHHDTRRREPWLLTEANRARVRDVIRKRYEILPYIYTVFYRSHIAGEPVMRPLWVEFPDDKSTFSIQTSFMLGGALLVSPVVDPGVSQIDIYLPSAYKTLWYDVSNMQVYHGKVDLQYVVTMDTVPIFMRGGTIVPKRERVRRSAILGRDDPYTLTVALDEKGSAKGELYEDDYTSFAYQKGQFSQRLISYNNGRLSSSKRDVRGVYSTKSWLERVYIIGMKQEPRRVRIDAIGSVNGILDFEYNPVTMVLVIRKPGVNMGQDWTIMVN